MAPAALSLLLSYLLGSIPIGFLLCKQIKGVDLRTVGSRNIGSTNAMRVLGRPLGVVAFLGDLGKGWAPTFLIAPWLTDDHEWLRVAAGAAAVCGHVWPVFLRFKGGKAVATGCGAIVGLDPWIFVVGGVIWLVVLVTTRFVGLSSMAMGVAFPVTAAVLKDGAPVICGTSVLALLILLRHRPNLMRMLAGAEPRIGRKGA